MRVSIDKIVFMDDDDRVFSEGVDEYWTKYKDGIPIDPVEYIFEKGGKYYAGEGRHRTYMYHHRLGMKTIDIIQSKIPLNNTHRFHLKHGCVTINDLYEESMFLED
ncbi:hypothetical protein JW756_00145 [Candidatus Woesearchaeota archaeon]|nr:hypothetical protein [Candidatus Woesearchaeota archaeon]